MGKEGAEDGRVPRRGGRGGGGPGEEADWARVITAATRAPSIHNTQPWRFTATPDRLEVFLDRARALPVLDPTGRQQVISCGTAIAFATVALRAEGHEAAVELLPDQDG